MDKKFCTNCGNSIDSNTSYCDKCGSNIKDSDDNESGETLKNNRYNKFIPILGLIAVLIIAIFLLNSISMEKGFFEGFNIDVPKEANMKYEGGRYVDVSNNFDLQLDFMPIPVGFVSDQVKKARNSNHDVDVHDSQNGGKVVIFEEITSKEKYNGYYVKGDKVLHVKSDNKELIRKMLDSAEFTN